ncbi:MAG: ATP-binding protein [Oscillospiraceae bacterium]|jgi:predicted AAA+ superfamily ATPase|nr:ATP-binding protein [Oscillospiraceae bacterium]
MIKRPLYTERLKKFIGLPFIKILTGVRRCGKSTILKLLIQDLKSQGVKEEQIIFMDYGSLAYNNFKDYMAVYNNVKSKITTKEKYYIFLDEFQEVDDWEKVANSLFNDFNSEIFITGSNSKMLSSEISTYLSGRYKTFHILPLSFFEYLDFKKSYRKIRDKKEKLYEYIKLGGFPATNIREMTKEETYSTIQDIYNSIIVKDILDKSEVRRVDMLHRIVAFLIENTGKIFSAKSIIKFFKRENRKIDIDTIHNYIALLEKAFMIYKCENFDIQGKEVLGTQEKYYIVDSSLKYANFRYDEKSLSAMLENIVFLEMKRRGYKIYIGKISNLEIDFIGEKNDDKIYIQVCKEITGYETREREYENLLKIKDNHPKYVVMDYVYAEGNYDGIKTINIADFLLDESW